MTCPQHQQRAENQEEKGCSLGIEQLDPLNFEQDFPLSHRHFYVAGSLLQGFKQGIPKRGGIDIQAVPPSGQGRTESL